MKGHSMSRQRFCFGLTQHTISRYAIRILFLHYSYLFLDSNLDIPAAIKDHKASTFFTNAPFLTPFSNKRLPYLERAEDMGASILRYVQ